MALDRRLDAIVQAHADNVLTADFTPGGRRVLNEYIQKASAATVTEPPGGDGPDASRAEESMRQVLAEAERSARSRGSGTIDEQTVRAAFIKLCPGLFPWC